MNKKVFKFTVKKLEWVDQETMYTVSIAKTSWFDIVIEKHDDYKYLVNFCNNCKYAGSLKDAKRLAQEMWKQELHNHLEKVFKYINVVD